MISAAHWTVLNEGNNLIKLYSGTNYLALINGVTQIVNIVSKGACITALLDTLPSLPNFNVDDF